MLASHIQMRTSNARLVRLLAILGFTAVTALGARLAIPLPFTPVPITLQVLAVLLAGLTLGARDGAASQALYLAAITAGLPLDAKGLGAAVWATPTAGYLVGFIAAAFTAGLLAEIGLRRRGMLRFAAGIVGVAIIYLFGVAWLTLGFLGGEWGQGWALGVAPFIVVDIGKALLAAGLAAGARRWLARAGGGQG